MEKSDKEILRRMLYDYGNEGMLKELALAIRERADDQSDIGSKDQAKESAELADTLIQVRSSLKMGRAKMVKLND